MIIEPKKTTLAYRCPACGGVPTSIVGIFSLSAELFKLKCDCGGSALTIQKTNDGQLLLVELEDLNPYLSLLELNEETVEIFINDLVDAINNL